MCSHTEMQEVKSALDPSHMDILEGGVGSQFSLYTHTHTGSRSKSLGGQLAIICIHSLAFTASLFFLSLLLPEIVQTVCQEAHKTAGGITTSHFQVNEFLCPPPTIPPEPHPQADSAVEATLCESQNEVIILLL